MMTMAEIFRCCFCEGLLEKWDCVGYNEVVSSLLCRKCGEWFMDSTNMDVFRKEENKNVKKRTAI